DERGNTLLVQRDSGHLAAPGVPGHGRAGEQWSARGSKPYCEGVDVSQHVSFAWYGKATRGRPRSEPDWGKPTVRDRRGACGNVDQGGTRHPPRISKERVLETLHLKLCAPQIYPDCQRHYEDQSLQCTMLLSQASVASLCMSDCWRNCTAHVVSLESRGELTRRHSPGHSRRGFRPICHAFRTPAMVRGAVAQSLGPGEIDWPACSGISMG